MTSADRRIAEQHRAQSTLSNGLLCVISKTVDCLLWKWPTSAEIRHFAVLSSDACLTKVPRRFVCQGCSTSDGAARGITYVPDFVANAGGVIQIYGSQAGWTEDCLRTARGLAGDVLRQSRERRRQVTPIVR